MNFQPKILPFDLREHVNSYAYDAKKFSALENAIAVKIIAYDEEYGHYLLSHLNRTSRYLEEFMLFKGYAPETAKKVGAAFRLHDAGKILQDIAVWEHTEEKPTFEKKTERAKHTGLGKNILLQTIEELGLDLKEDDNRHIQTIIYMMEAHHERENGIGPLKYRGDQMDEILKMATILDEIDGKIKLDHESLDGIFADIRGRHSAKFDMSLVSDCYRYCVQYGRYADLSAILTPNTLAP